MEPIPETTEAVDEFGPFHEDDLLVELRRRSGRVQEIVPTCVGMSVASHRAGVTFTFVATSAEVAALDGVQYLAGGPCVAAVEAERVLEYGDRALFDEAGWHLFARATAVVDVASTLTLPVVAAGRVSGSVNLYATTPYAFSGHHEAIARIFDAWAPGAVANADLSFSTRRLAEQAPDQLRAEYAVAVAVAILVEQQRLTADRAREVLRDAAARAGVTESQLADTVIALRRMSDSE